MNESINKLWQEEKMPLKSAIYFSNEICLEFIIIAYPDFTVKKGNFFNVDEFLLQNPKQITNLDIIEKLILSSNNTCLIGEGSHGSEGFIACINEKKSLNWILYSEESNPFIKIIEQSPNLIIVSSSAGFNLIINIDEPENMELVKYDFI